MVLKSNAELVVARVVHDGLKPTDYPEFRYKSLPLALIDAVYSIGAKYDSTRATIRRFNNYVGWGELFANDRYRRGPGAHRISELIPILSRESDEYNAESIFGNRQRTSPRNGILKAAAVRLGAAVLAESGAEDLLTAQAGGLDRAERKFRMIPGQKSGISYAYLRMLAGNDQMVKADRMVQRYLEKALGRRVDQVEAEDLLAVSSEILRARDSSWNPRLLDGAIWQLENRISTSARQTSRPCGV